MCKGWAKGSQSFKKAVLEACNDAKLKHVVVSEAKEMREPVWERLLDHNLKLIARTAEDLQADRKGAVWKVALARYLRESHLILHAWLVGSLHIGTPNSLNSQISRHQKNVEQHDQMWDPLINQENVD